MLANAAGAALGMARIDRKIAPEEGCKGIIGMTNLGVLTNGAMHAIDLFHKAGYEVITFHAIGAGGRAMEQMMREGIITAVFDYALGEIADEIFGFLEERGYSASIYHMNLPPKKRIQSIDDYRSGKTKILVSCRALDEGFDVPKSEVGIIVAGTSSVRQWIQRMGRILRRAPDKGFSRIFVVFVDFIEKDVFQETELREFEKEALSVELISLNNPE